MKVHFVTPPPAQRVGGLDAAIDGLRAALGRFGVPVDDDFPQPNEGESVVHFHGIWQPGAPRLAQRCAAAKIPFVVSPHGMLEPWAMRHKRWKKWPYFHLIEKRFLRRATALLATSRLEADRLRDLVRGPRIESLPLGMTGAARPDYEAARARLGWPDTERVLLFLSRLNAKKGLDHLLHALATIEPAQPLRLVIVGGGEAEYIRQIRALAYRLKEKLPPIDWVGEIWGDARWAYFQGADLFCLPTHSENFGLAVLEACQVGTPVLTTSATPWTEHRRERRISICEPDVASVRESLRQILDQPKLSTAERAAFSDWAWATFHWDALAPQYVALYQSLRAG